MQPIAIFGAGGLGREILALIRQINRQQNRWTIIGFFDDNIPEGQTVHEVPVLGGMTKLNTWPDDLWLVIALGDPGLKMKMVKKITNGKLHFPVLVHPKVEIMAEEYVKIGQGSVITAGNTLTTDIEIGEHVLLNLHCTVGHDVRIGSFSSLMPGVHVSGNITVGEGVYIGTGAVLIHSIFVAPYTTIGAGAAVVNEIANQTTVVGVPARPLPKKKKD